MRRKAFLVIALLIFPSVTERGWSQSVETTPKPIPSQSANQTCEVDEAALGGTKNVHVYGNLFFSGQFGADDIAAIKAAGVQRIISLRTEGEVNWDEKKAVTDAGLEFSNVPFRGADDLTDELLGSLRQTLRKSADTKTLLHCGSANRVGAVWLAYRVLDEKAPLDKALVEAKTVGLRNPALQDRTIAYIQKEAEKAGRSNDATPQGDDIGARPEINAPFLDPHLDVQQWIDRFEVESREIYSSRSEILKTIDLQPGQTVADIGAGTGLFTRLMSPMVGSSGRVFAVDIAPAFLQHINETAEKTGLQNITPVLCSRRSVYLPRGIVDVAFVCDTYHHFEFPRETLASILAALKPGGRLVVVDFIREEGKSSDWIVGHVRAGKETVRAEIETAGFEFVSEPAVAGLQENYLFEFKKPAIQ